MSAGGSTAAELSVEGGIKHSVSVLFGSVSRTPSRPSTLTAVTSVPATVLVAIHVAGGVCAALQNL